MIGWVGHWGGHGPWIGLVWIAIWGAVVLGAIYVLRRGRSRWHEGSAESVLGERYARGEISEEEYRKRRAVLRERAR